MSGGLDQRLAVRLLRRIPRGVPARLRLGWLLLGDLWTRTDEVIYDRDGIAYLVPCLGHSIGLHLLLDGVYDGELVDFIRSRTRSVFVDVGANIGAIALPVAKAMGAEGTVLAIEGSPWVFEYLAKNVAANGCRNVILARCAATTANTSSMPFFEAPAIRFGRGSLAPQFTSSATEVEGRSIDSLLAEHGINQVDVLKVDVEGFEAEVFMGARELLSRRDAPIVVFEFSDLAESLPVGGHVCLAQEILIEYGYQLWTLESLRHRKPPLAAPVTCGFETMVGIKPGTGH